MRPPTGRPWVIAHRGASAAWPENTLAAFRGAAVLGADAVELDARRTADGSVVVHHDATVPGLGPIVERTAAEWRRLAPWMPTLAEALEACAGMWVNVEVKNSPTDPDWDPAGALVPGVVEEIAGAGRTATTLLTSFDPAVVTAARALCPELATGWLVETESRRALSWVVASGHAALLPHHSALAGSEAAALAGAARASGALLITWTVDDPAEGCRLAAAGLDGIITNRPDDLLSALGKHGHRHSG